MNETKATRYQRLKRRAQAADVASGVALLAALALTSAARLMAAWSAALTASWPSFVQLPLAVTLFVCTAVILWEIVALPAVLYLGLGVDRRFGQNDGSIDGLFAAQLHATMIALPVALLTAAIVMLSTRLAGAYWWMVAGVMLAVALVAATRTLPDVLIRIGRVRPVGRRALLAGLREVARRSDVPVSDILEWQLPGGVHPTALLTGLGRTRRVFIASEMLRDWSDDEIVVVVAHELAHHVHHDLWRTLALNGVVLSVGLGMADRAIAWAGPSLALAGTADLAALPLIALVTAGVWLAAAPLRHAQSRDHERRADRFALNLTGGADAFGTAIRRLSAQYLSEERPSMMTRWLFHRHPTVAERLELANEFSRSLKA